MPWNTIDLITMVPRNAEAAEYQGKDTNMTQNIQNSEALSAQQNAEQRATQTVETQQSETEQYDMDDGQGRGAGRGANGRRRKKKKTDEQPVAPKSNSKFDVYF